MPLTFNSMPSNPPTRAVPIDVNMMFTQNYTFTASGPLSSTGQGGPAFQADLGGGRLDGLWVVDLQTLKVSAGDEKYQLALLGSNDAAFGAGNVELLAFHDWAAAASARLVPSFCRASPAFPDTPPVPGRGRSVSRHVFPFSNEIEGYVLRYAQVYLTVGGTAPSMKLASWISESR